MNLYSDYNVSLRNFENEMSSHSHNLEKFKQTVEAFKEKHPTLFPSQYVTIYKNMSLFTSSSEVYDYLLEKINVKKFPKKGEALLHEACDFNSITSFEALLNAEVNPNALDKKGTHPLLLVLQTVYSTYKIEALMNAGADINWGLDDNGKQRNLMQAALIVKPELVPKLLTYQPIITQKDLQYAQKNEPKLYPQLLSYYENNEIQKDYLNKNWSQKKPSHTL